MLGQMWSGRKLVNMNFWMSLVFFSSLSQGHAMEPCSSLTLKWFPAAEDLAPPGISAPKGKTQKEYARWSREPNEQNDRWVASKMLRIPSSNDLLTSLENSSMAMKDRLDGIWSENENTVQIRGVYQSLAEPERFLVIYSLNGFSMVNHLVKGAEPKTLTGLPDAKLKRETLFHIDESQELFHLPNKNELTNYRRLASH